MHRLGQNFLIDGNLMRRLVASAEILPGDVVLEVGGGTGGLTDLLVEAGATVVCVEVDARLAQVLMRRFQQTDRVRIISADALSGKNRLSPVMMAALSEALSERGTGRAMLVANLPYQIATPLVMNLLLNAPWMHRMCFTVQAEVGQRILAEPGSRDYGPVSILMQFVCDVRVVARVGPQSFWPAPRVASMMLRADVRGHPLGGAEELRRFSLFVRSVFDHRRKKLRSALRYVLGDAPVQRMESEALLDRRAEELTVAEWVGLFQRT